MTAVILLARVDTCPLCANAQRVRVVAMAGALDGIVPCPLCGDAAAVAEWVGQTEVGGAS